MGAPNPKKAWKKYEKAYRQSIGEIDFEEKSEMSEIHSEIKREVEQFDGKGAQNLIDKMNEHTKTMNQKREERNERLKSFEENYESLKEAYYGGMIKDSSEIGFNYINQVRDYLILTRVSLTKYKKNSPFQDKETVVEKIQELKKKLKKIGYKEVVEQ